MEIVKIPIVDFFKYSLDSAYQRGFSWVMCLLARDADAEETYQQVKRYWDSLHDLTGKNILFVFAGKQVEEKQPNSLLWHEAKDYRALTNPSIRFINDDAPTVPNYLYPSFVYETYQINEVTVTHTRSITELRDFFGLSERDVPSLVFVPTHSLSRKKKIVIQLQKENLYQMVKEIILSLEEPLKKLKKAQDDYSYIAGRLTEINNEIEHLQKGTSVQNRYTKARNYLNRLAKDTEDRNLKKWLQDAIRDKSVYEWHRFDHQTRAYLNQYLDLLKRYPTLDNDCKTIVSRLVTLEGEQRKIGSVRREMHDRITSLYDELAQVIQGIKESAPSTMVTKSKGSRRFKISLSFPGEHRVLVENIAEKLAAIIGKERILYDKYHRAEFARPNLDIHLQNLYKNESELIVVFICDDYNKKKWCGIEWRAIRELLNSKEMDNRIMFVKCGEGAVDGVFDTIDGYIDLAEVTITDTINDILKRYSSLFDIELLNNMDNMIQRVEQDQDSLSKAVAAQFGNKSQGIFLVDDEFINTIKIVIDGKVQEFVGKVIDMKHSIDHNAVISTVKGSLIFKIKNNSFTKYIKFNDKFILSQNVWRVIGVDDTDKHTTTVTCEKELINLQNDDMDNKLLI